MQSPTLFLLIILWFISLKTKYAGVTSFLVFICMAINCMNIFRIYPFHERIEQFVDTSTIKVGDVISTHQYLLHEKNTLMLRLAYTALTGDLFFHTVLVVNYNNQKYVIHANWHKIEQLRSNLSEIQNVGQQDSMFILLEPLESFLKAEKQQNSIIRITSSGKSIDFSQDTVDVILKRPIGIPTNCCCFVGRYLENYGILKNRSALSDSIYFLPKYFPSQFGNVRYFKL